METERILVTGGGGFIGTNLVNELRKRGHEVIELDLYNTDREGYLRADVRNYRQLERAFEKWKFDSVYHLAAEYGRWNGEDYYENLWATNAIGTKHIIRLQEKLGFRMIFFSSAEVYGDYEGIMREDVMEKNPIKDTYQMNDYAITNLFLERKALPKEQRSIFSKVFCLQKSLFIMLVEDLTGKRKSEIIQIPF
ncbi:MAG: NAD-dependent epimerase/dehydratase family protein [Methanophagales archaeon]|nr:NAD-dependent epimerase/dehydratase family protein [Methanophagales archaeon]